MRRAARDSYPACESADGDITMNAKRWYLAIVQFNAGRDDLLERLKRDVPTIDAALKKLSDAERCTIATRSSNGQTVVWLLRTGADSKRISNRIMNPEGTAWTAGSVAHERAPDTFRSGDKILVFELGDDRCLTDLNVIQNWLSHIA